MTQQNLEADIHGGETASEPCAPVVRASGFIQWRDRVSDTNKKHEHMRREPLPWRVAEEALTECGIPADPRTTLSRADMLAKIDREGQHRSSLSSCMTCWTTASRNRDEASLDGIAKVIAREIARVQWKKGPERDRLSYELRALTALADTHREEFTALVASYADVVKLSEHRKRKVSP